jgi:DNA-binding GntR family transcriptional regulator
MNEQANNPFEVPATVSETIYKYLKKAIIEGEFKPNQRIQEKEIAGLFNVSTTPVRESFRRLAAEKFLTIDARRGIVVISTSLDQIKDLFEVVAVLDVFATKRAIKNLSRESIEQLKQLTRELGESYRGKQILSYVKKNFEIHIKIWEYCGNEFLRRALTDYGEKIVFHMNQFFLLLPEQATYFDKSYQDHLDLLVAIENKEEAQVERILLSHWGKDFFGETDSEKR